MSNLNLTVGKSVRNLVDFIKSNVQDNMYITLRDGDISLTEDEIKNIIGVATKSVDQAYQNGYIEVEAALKDATQ